MINKRRQFFICLFFILVTTLSILTFLDFRNRNISPIIPASTKASLLDSSLALPSQQITDQASNSSSLIEEYPETKSKIIEEEKQPEPMISSRVIDYRSKIAPLNQLVRHLFNIKSVPFAKALAFSPDGKEMWTTLLSNKRRGVSVFLSSTGQKIADIDLAGKGGVEMIFSADGEKAYVSQMETGKIFEINTQSKEIARVFFSQGIWTKVLVLSFDEKTLFASNWSSNDISVINLESGELLYRLPTVDTPRGLYPTENGKTLYVAGFQDGEIEKINLETKESQVIFKSGGAMRHIVADEEEGILYCSDMGRDVIWKVSMKNDKVKKFVATDHNPNTIVLSPDKRILFVSSRGINASATNYYVPGPEWGSILLFDTETGEMLDAIVAGNQPTALDISPDGRLLVFSNFLDARLEVFAIPSFNILKEGEGGRSNIYQKELRK
jgi:DNA-binding beta-propeller fold protein YncE